MVSDLCQSHTLCYTQACTKQGLQAVRGMADCCLLITTAQYEHCKRAHGVTYIPLRGGRAPHQSLLRPNTVCTRDRPLACRAGEACARMLAMLAKCASLKIELA